MGQGRETTVRSDGRDRGWGVARRCSGLLLVVAASWALLLVIGLLVRESPAVGTLDESIARALIAASPAWTSGPARVLDIVLGPPSMVVLLVVVTLGVAGLSRGTRRERIVAGVHAASAGTGAWALEALAKRIVDRPRPGALAADVGVVPLPHSASFPSGHTACAAILATLLVVAVMERASSGAGASARTGRWITAAVAVLGVLLGALLVLATAWSRVRLGVHHPSDVLASALLMPPLVAGLTGALGAFGSGRMPGRPEVVHTAVRTETMPLRPPERRRSRAAAPERRSR